MNHTICPHYHPHHPPHYYPLYLLHYHPSFYFSLPHNPYHPPHNRPPAHVTSVYLWARSGAVAPPAKNEPNQKHKPYLIPLTVTPIPGRLLHALNG